MVHFQLKEVLHTFALCVLVSFCPTSWFSNVALASSWVEKMKTDLYQLIDAVTQDTFNIVYDPFTTGNMHGYVYQKEERNFSWHSMWKMARAFCNPWQESQSGFFTWNCQNNYFFNRFLLAFEPRNMGIYGRFHVKMS